MLLQYMPILVEIVLLFIIGYFYLSTRRMVQDVRTELDRKEKYPAGQSPQDIERRNVKMAKEVAALLTELQNTANTAQIDISQQRNELTNLVSQAQFAINDLHNALENRPEAPVVTPPAAANISQTPLVQGDNLALEITVGEAVTRFANFLYANGRSVSTVKRVVVHLKEFATWWQGQRFEQMVMLKAGLDDLDNFYVYLKGQDYQPDTLQRKMTAVKTFVVWTNTGLKSGPQQPERSLTPEPPTELQADPESEPLTPKAETKREQVMRLAAEGLDHRAIAAEIGLEQETVRLMLAMQNDEYELPALLEPDPEPELEEDDEESFARLERLLLQQS